MIRSAQSREFSERLFSVGTLTGLRAFDVDRLGRLVAPSQRTIFLPGENKAECRKSAIYNTLLPSFMRSAYSTNITFDPKTGDMRFSVADEVAPELKEPEHTVGALNCGCGFYAYTDGANEYYQGDKSTRVAAIIEGYGICTTGSRGFRASKARVAALICPHRKFDESTGQDGRWDRVLHNYPGIPVFASKAAALAEFPLSAPTFPTPESDESFWTREATR